MNEEVIEVAAGLVFHEGRLLITRRPADAHLANLWEFPGGKRETEESFEDCLKRELHEELSIEVETRELLSEIEHSYPEKKVRLRFFKCRWLRGDIKAVGCQAFAWITCDELGRYQFPEADALLLKQLAETPRWWD